MAGPQSTNYELKEYGFGAGGTGESGITSTSYTLFGTIGETDNGTSQSTSYKTIPGLLYTLQSDVPTVSLTNPSNTYYNKLHIAFTTGTNPTDATYAIAVSTDNFVSDTRYVQTDTTIGASIVWQTASAWSNSGFDIIGLLPGTTYTVKVAARQGNFTQSPWSATSAVATVNPTLSFSLSPSSISSWTLTPGSVGTAPSTATVTITTNAYNGAAIYIYDSKSGLQSLTASHTISSVSNDLTAIGEGYGARSTATTQTSGGPMRALSPYNGSGTNVGILDSTKRTIFDSSGATVTNGQGTFELKAKPAVTAGPGSDYIDTITIISSASF